MRSDDEIRSDAALLTRCYGPVGDNDNAADVLVARVAADVGPLLAEVVGLRARLTEAEQQRAHVHDADTAYDGWCATCPPTTEERFEAARSRANRNARKSDEWMLRAVRAEAALAAVRELASYRPVVSTKGST